VSNLLVAMPLGLVLRFARPLPLWPDLMLQAAVQTNIVIAMFNLLPLPPLDGHSVLLGLLSLSRHTWAWRASQFMIRLQQQGPLVLILVIIAVPSFKLLNLQYAYPKADLTIKATGYQWYWSHQYPDQGGFSFDSYMLDDEGRNELIEKGIDAPRNLAVDNEVVVPVNKVVHVLVTAEDVLHNWTIPAFGSKTDAVPGRLTATWFKAEREGVFYGQCSELCGINHAFMPIAVRVVSEETFNKWVEARKADDEDAANAIIHEAALALKAKKKVASVAN